jgi:hypothetical protein
MTTLHIITEAAIIASSALVCYTLYVSADKGIWGNKPSRAQRKAAKRFRKRSTRECEAALRQEARNAASSRLLTMRRREEARKWREFCERNDLPESTRNVVMAGKEN